MIGKVETRSDAGGGILPVRTSGGTRWDGDTAGLRALMLAVLEDALRCIERGRGHRTLIAQRLAAEAEAWVRSDRRDRPFSFVNVCAALGFEPNAVRTCFVRMPEHRHVAIRSTNRMERP